MFRNNDIPQEYNKLAEISDNYLVWVRESSLSSGTNYSAYIQYIYPSPSLLFTTNYKITKGDYYNLEANYSNNGMYNYITDYDVNFTKTTTLVDLDDYFDNSDYSRADFPTLFMAQFIIVIMLYFIINKITRLCFKGGV